MNKRRLILASGSTIRQKMLYHAGLDCEVIPADLDEEALKADDENPVDVAVALSKAKANHVSQEHPEALVIGADQVLVFEGQIYSKAKDTHEAREKLRAMRGKTHSLISAVSVSRHQETLWSAYDMVDLTMYDFDDDFLERYCEKAGDALTRSVGAYEYESVGSWLFNNVQGDYFTILGMPLLPLLGYLRSQGFGP